jgi:hypothetical protein
VIRANLKQSWKQVQTRLRVESVNQNNARTIRCRQGVQMNP